MVSPQAFEKLFANAKIEMFDHDPDTTAATVITPDGGTTLRWVSLQDYENFAALVMASTLTGAGATLVEIVAADDATGTNTVVIKSSGAVVMDAVGDYVALECSAAEVRQEGNDNSSTPIFVAARVTNANAADENVATYIRYDPRFPESALTATTIA